MWNKIRDNKKYWIVAAVVIVATGGAFSYFGNSEGDTQESEAPEIQTAVVRQGDILVSATGTGTLIPADKVDLAFRGSGQVTELYVSVGDVVEEGQMLAELDVTLEQIQLKEAERDYLELTSPAAIAASEETLLLAEEEQQDAWYGLAWVISGSVLRYEEQVENLGAALSEAEAAAEGSTSAESQQAVEEAQRLLNNAEAGLRSAWYYYDQTYIEDNFTVEECTGEGRNKTCETYLAPPSEANIDEARNRLVLAETALVEAEYYLQALTEGEIPAGATGAGIAKLEQAQFARQKAQYDLDSNYLYAPISGTVLAVDIQVGDSAGSSPVITVANLNESYIEIYLDETDFDKIDIDYEVEVVFDIYPDDVFAGRVTQVDPQLVSIENVPAVKALVRLDDSPALQTTRLQIGSNAIVEVIAGRADKVLLVPVEALRQISAGEYAVFVMEDGEPKLRMVEVGLMDITYAEILSGLERGDVVTTGIVEVE